MGKKHKAESRDFVSQYETIRSILRAMSLYGCSTVDDFKAQGISPSKYNQLIRKFTGFIEWKYMKRQRIDSKEAIYFTSDMFDTDYNYLLDTLTMKSFADTKVAASLKIMQILTKSPTPLTRGEIWGDVADTRDNNKKGEPLSESSINRILQTLVEIGYVNIDDEQSKYTYCLSTDPFEELDEQELQRLMQFVDVMRNVVYPSTCGNFLFESINLYRESKGISKKYENPFQLKHNKLWYVLEDEVLWRLLRAINDEKTVSLDYEHNDGTMFIRSYKNICPIIIVAEERFGRRYLSVHGEKDQNLSSLLRLDKISKVKINIEDIELSRAKLLEEHREKMKYSVMGISPRMSSDTIKEVSLVIPQDLLRDVQAELKLSSMPTIEKEGNYCVTLQVSSVDELKPFLRRFIGKIEVKNSKEHNLRETLQEELAEWRKLYGIV